MRFCGLLATCAGQVRALLLRLRQPLVVIAGIGSIVSGLGQILVYLADGCHPAQRVLEPRRKGSSPPRSSCCPPLTRPGAPGARTSPMLAHSDHERPVGHPQCSAVIVPSQTAASPQAKGQTLGQWSSEAYVRFGFVLSGAVSSSGERVHVHAQLAGVLENARLWSKTFEGTLPGVFALQEYIY